MGWTPSTARGRISERDFSPYRQQQLAEPTLLYLFMFLSGEVRRTMDERFRLSLPPEFASAVCDDDGIAILAKERTGCLSLWPRKEWEQKLETGVNLLRQKMSSGRMEGRYADVQRLGRLLSTRHQQVTLAKRSRLVIPETFRDFLGTAAGQEVVIVGAAVCVEIWHSERWLDVLKAEMPDFGELFKTLTE